MRFVVDSRLVQRSLKDLLLIFIEFCNINVLVRQNEV